MSIHVYTDEQLRAMRRQVAQMQAAIDHASAAEDVASGRPVGGPTGNRATAPSETE